MMHAAFEHLDLGKLTLSAGGHPPPYQIVVRAADAVRGNLAQGAGKLEVRDLALTKLVLDALQLVLGTVVVRAEREAVFKQLEGSVLQSAARLELSLVATDVDAIALGIDVAETKLAGETRMREVTLNVGSDAGHIATQRLEVDGFRAGHGELGADAAQLRADDFLVGWGAELRISAGRVEVPSLTVSLGTGARLELSGVTLSALELRGARITLGELKIAGGRLKLPLSPSDSSESGPPAPKEQAAESDLTAFDLQLLDGLSGCLQVDALVDMTIPIFGLRRAKHALRLTVEDGSVDYRELEADLAPLESSLLDFSVRDGDLVLERGIPLLPTRGFGKPLIRWELDAADRALADKRRVRLSLLPRFKLPDRGKPRDDDEDAAPSKVALRKLGLNNIDLRLSLRPAVAPRAALRKVSIEELIVRGNIQHHVTEADPEGAVEGSLKGLNLSIAELPFGTHKASVEELRIAAVPRFVVRFAGLKPTAVELVLEELSLRDLSFA